MFIGLELLLAVPEVKTPLPGGSRPTQTDSLALARSDAGLISVAVEDKAAEPFGPTLRDWQTDGEGKRARWEFSACNPRAAGAIGCFQSLPTPA